MDETRHCLIHIGYHKTASTYLQRQFFTPDFGFSRWPDNQLDVHPALVNLGPYEAVPEETRLYLEQRRHQAQVKGLQFVISHERLSGHPSSGGYDSRILAERVNKLFPASKVLIVIREQCSMIRSAYSQFITEGGSISLSKYLQNPEPFVRRMPGFALSHFEFAPAIRCYRNLFGDENVLVLPFELFLRDPVEFLNRIGRFAKMDEWVGVNQESYRPQVVNAGRTVPIQTIRRTLNACFVRRQFSNSGFFNIPKLIRAYDRGSKYLDRVVPASLNKSMVSKQKELISRRVGNHFVCHNRATSELIGIELRDFGYQVEPKG